MQKMKMSKITEKTPEEINRAEQQIFEQSKRIEFYITEYSIEYLADKMNEGRLVIPSYQRDFTWEDDRKSRFIESLLMGLPIPFLFFWEMPDGRLEIVDGSQRLRTIEEFVLKGFRLGKLESLPSVSGFTYSELSESRQRKVTNRSIRGIVLNEHADEQARFDMFDRINTGSKIANKAEVRRGALTGPFMDMITEVAALPEFIRLAPASVKLKKEREHEELVARFFAYSDGLEKYKDRPSEFLFNYVKTMNEKVAANPAILDAYRQKIQTTLKAVETLFPYGFRKSAKGNATPRARFEAIAIGTHSAIQENPDLLKRNIPNVTEWIESDEFRKIVGSDGANAISRLKGRISFVKNKLLKS